MISFVLNLMQYLLVLEAIFKVVTENLKELNSGSPANPLELFFFLTSNLYSN